MTPPDDPLLVVRQDVVEGVRALLDTFGGGDDGPEPGRAPGRLPSSIQKLQADPRAVYMMLAFSAATIRWASHETSRDEVEILNEISHGFGVS
jgi:hypothetical protein